MACRMAVMGTALTDKKEEGLKKLDFEKNLLSIHPSEKEDLLGVLRQLPR